MKFDAELLLFECNQKLSYTSMSDLSFASVCQLAQMIRDRQVSAVEVLDAHLTQIEKHNSTTLRILRNCHSYRNAA